MLWNAEKSWLDLDISPVAGFSFCCLHLGDVKEQFPAISCKDLRGDTHCWQTNSARYVLGQVSDTESYVLKI